MPLHPSGEAYGQNVEKVTTDLERWREWLRKHRQQFDTQQAYRLGDPFSARSVCKSLYKPQVPLELRRNSHDEMVIRFKLKISFTVFEPVNAQLAKIQSIAKWVQENQA